MPFDYVISSYPPVATHLTALILKRRHPKLIWVADFRDPLSGNPGATDKRTFFWDKHIERVIFTHADCTIATTDALANLWRDRYPKSKSKVTHIWNGFDPADEIEPLPIPSRDQKITAHVGEIYNGRHPRLLLSGLKHLLETRAIDTSRVKFWFFGDLDPRLDLSMFSGLIEQGVLSLFPQAKSSAEARRLMAEANSLLLVDWTDNSGGYQVPAKLYLYIRIGRPILAITKIDSPVERILAKSDVPYVCLYPGDSPEQCATKLQEFLQLSSTPVQPSDWFLHEFDAHGQAKRLAGILASIKPEGSVPR